MILLNEDWTFTATDADCDIGYAGENGVRTLYIRTVSYTHLRAHET